MVPQHIREEWLQWSLELKLLSTTIIPQCYFPKDSQVSDIELHGFCDESEAAYAAVVYVWILINKVRYMCPWQYQKRE